MTMNLRKLRKDEEITKGEFNDASLVLDRLRLCDANFKNFDMNKLLRLMMLFFKNDPQYLPKNADVQSFKTLVKDNKPHAEKKNRLTSRHQRNI